MFETVMQTVFKKLVFKTFFTILFTGIYFQSFLRLATCTVAVGTQPTYLINAAIVSHFPILHIAFTFPFPPVHVIISCLFGVNCIKHYSWNHNASLVIKQIQRVGTDRDNRQSMGVTAQGLNEIAVGHHLTDTTVIFVEHCRSNHDTMLDGIRKIKVLLKAINYSVNI